MPRPAISEHRKLFCDLETGGLKPAYHEMLEIACILTDPTGQHILNSYCAKVKPKMPERVDAKAASINGYTVEKWAAEAVDLNVAMANILSMAKDTMWVGHNAPFDWGFFERAMSERGQRWPGDYHKIDTVALSAPLLVEGIVPNVKLATLTNFFSIKHENAHTAMADVEACRQLYLRLMSMYVPAVQNLKGLPSAGPTIGV